LAFGLLRLGADVAGMDRRFNKETSNNYGAEMELSDLLIFAVMFVVAYVIFKIMDKKMGP
jgi:hypothetical protein